MNGVVILKYSGLFLPRDLSETLVVFEDSFAAASEPNDVYYTAAGLEQAATNYDAQNNQLQAEELRVGLKALRDFRTKHAHNY